MKERLTRLLELVCSVSGRWRDVDLHLRTGTEENAKSSVDSGAVGA